MGQDGPPQPPPPTQCQNLGGAGYAREWGTRMGWHARLGPDTPSACGGLGEGRDLLPRGGEGENRCLPWNFTGLTRYWVNFSAEQTLLCSARVADEGGVEAAPGLPLAEETLVIPVLPPVTRHPAVRTPGFLDQAAWPQAARAGASQQTGPLIRPGLLGPRKQDGSGTRDSFGCAGWKLMAGFSLPLFQSIQHFLHSSNPPREEGVKCPVASTFLKQSRPAPLGPGPSVLAPLCPECSGTTQGSLVIVR